MAVNIVLLCVGAAATAAFYYLSVRRARAAAAASAAAAVDNPLESLGQLVAQVGGWLGSLWQQPDGKRGATPTTRV